MIAIAASTYQEELVVTCWWCCSVAASSAAALKHSSGDIGDGMYGISACYMGRIVNGSCWHALLPNPNIMLIKQMTAE